MSIFLNNTTIVQDHLLVRLNPAGANDPFAVIELNENGDTSLAIHSMQEARALAAAASEVIALFRSLDEGADPMELYEASRDAYMAHRMNRLTGGGHVDG